MPVRLEVVHWLGYSQLRNVGLDQERLLKFAARHLGDLAFTLAEPDSVPPRESEGPFEEWFWTSNDVLGWRVRCSCGWDGPGYSRSEWRSRNGEPPAQVVEQAHSRWTEHMQNLSVVRLHTAHRAFTEARSELDRAVAAAKTDGVTWDEVGAVVGMSRQAAHERWHRPA